MINKQIIKNICNMSDGEMFQGKKAGKERSSTGKAF